MGTDVTGSRRLWKQWTYSGDTEVAQWNQFPLCTLESKIVTMSKTHVSYVLTHDAGNGKGWGTASL